MFKVILDHETFHLIALLHHLAGVYTSKTHMNQPEPCVDKACFKKNL